MEVFKAAELSQLPNASGTFIHLDGQASQVWERVDQKPQLVGWWKFVSGQVRQRDVDEGRTRRRQEGEQLLHVLEHSFLFGVLHFHCLHPAAMLPQHLDEGLGGGGRNQHGRQKSEPPPEVGGAVDYGVQKLARGCEGHERGVGKELKDVKERDAGEIQESKHLLSLLHYNSEKAIENLW